MGEDDRYVADFGYDGIGSVQFALQKMVRMDMDVGYNNASGLPTVYPEIAKQPAVDLDDSGVQGVRIYIVVEDELLDSPGGAIGAE